MTKPIHPRLRRQLILLLAGSLCASAPLVSGTESPATGTTGKADEIPQTITGNVVTTGKTSISAPLPAPSQNVTVNLINRMVARGLLPKEDAADLIQQAEADAQLARQQSDAVQAVIEQVAVAQSSIAPPVEPSGITDVAAGSEPYPPPDDTVRVTYIPESVKAQMQEEIRQEVVKQAMDENWANPRTFPEWASHLRFSGDVRLRGEGDYFPKGSDNTGAFANFNAINTGSPYDVSASNTQFFPTLNVDQDRQRFRIRVRFAAEADLGGGFTTGIRIATGENSSPVSTNQSLGASGGNFSKYAIWLDRAFIKYQLTGKPDKDLTLTAGRFENPFFATSLIWDDDLGFDGIVLQGKYEIVDGVRPFITAGAFPVYNTDYNFSSSQPAKFDSYDKYLYGGQVGTDWKISKDFQVKVGAAYYSFENIEGQLSEPVTILTAQDAASTDASRPSFAQKGNTYFPLRNIIPTADNAQNTKLQYQYFGLATPFREFALTGRLDYDRFEPVRVTLLGEYVQNLAFDSGDINKVAVNNLGPDVEVPDPANPGKTTTVPGPFVGGDTGWMVDLRVGSPVLENRWDWNFAFGYRYLESDAIVDGFADSDFGGGGTNLEGYTIGSTVVLSPSVWLGLRWLSATSIDGPTYKNDVIQIDLNAKF